MDGNHTFLIWNNEQVSVGWLPADRQYSYICSPVGETICHGEAGNHTVLIWNNEQVSVGWLPAD